MARYFLLMILVVILARAFWRLFDGVVEGVTGRRPAARTPQRAVHMVRDPVCGTFVVPERAIVLANGRDQIYFCSAGCRDQYQAHRARPA
jgi:YHS domain-containing protein